MESQLPQIFHEFLQQNLCIYIGYQHNILFHSISILEELYTILWPKLLLVMMVYRLLLTLTIFDEVQHPIVLYRFKERRN